MRKINKKMKKSNYMVNEVKRTGSYTYSEVWGCRHRNETDIATKCG